MAILPAFCNWHGPCCVMAVGIDNRHYIRRHIMNTLTSKLTAFAAAIVMNSLILGAVGFLFEIQSHPQLSVLSFVRPLVAQWLA
jgi:hypothetical protein